MKSHINIRNAKEIHSLWDETLSFCELSPTPKVISILEVIERTKLAALSAHFDYLGVISKLEAEKEILVIIYLKEKRVEAFKSFPYSVCVMYFIPECENVLLVGSSCGRIFLSNIDNKTSHILEGHKNPPRGIFHHNKSDILITWSSTEVLLWSWPDYHLTRRLNIGPTNYVLEGGYISDKSYIFVAFDSGVVLIWDQQQSMKEYAIEPPDGITMELKSFSLSMDGDWIIGVGSQSIILVYSVANLCVVQAIHLSSPEFLLGIEKVQFLPCIHPQFPKTYLLQTPNCVIIVDFVNSSTIKLLKSPRESIRNVCVSSNGFLLAVVYSNGSTKLYTLLSFFPKPMSTLKLEKNEDVGFSILKTGNSQKEKKKAKAAQLFDATKWKSILEEFEEFPQRYRKYIWISLLKLPQNFSILNGILCKEKRHKFETLKNEFQHLNSSTLEVLKGTLECLCYWSPFLAGVEFLPQFVLPFVEFFEPNLLTCFEAALTIILNWCRFWFRKWPNPPEIILNLVDELICEQDADLWIHLKEIGTPPGKCVWPILTSAFRLVFTRKDWHAVWDHILTQPPSFVICVCAAFILSLRQTLLKCSKESHVKELFCQETWVQVRTIVRRAKKLGDSLKIKDDVREEMEILTYLPRDSLLPFDIGPQADLPWQCYSTLGDTAHSAIDLKSILEGKKAISHSSPKRRINPSRNSGEKTFPSDVAVLESGHFNKLEDACLRSMQNTRKKLINRIE